MDRAGAEEPLRWQVISTELIGHSSLPVPIRESHQSAREQRPHRRCRSVSRFDTWARRGGSTRSDPGRTGVRRTTTRRYATDALTPLPTFTEPICEWLPSVAAPRRHPRQSTQAWNRIGEHPRDRSAPSGSSGDPLPGQGHGQGVAKGHSKLGRAR